MKRASVGATVPRREEREGRGLGGRGWPGGSWKGRPGRRDPQAESRPGLGERKRGRRATRCTGWGAGPEIAGRTAHGSRSQSPGWPSTRLLGVGLTSGNAVMHFPSEREGHGIVWASLRSELSPRPWAGPGLQQRGLAGKVGCWCRNAGHPWGGRLEFSGGRVRPPDQGVPSRK